MCHIPKKYQEIVHNLLRIVVAFLLIQHGAQKLFGVLGGKGGVELMSLMGVAGTLEFFGGILVLIGLFTRPVAFLLSGLMAIVYFKVHAFSSFWPILNMGELAVIFCFVFLFFAVCGAGKFSLDGLMCKKG